MTLEERMEQVSNQLLRTIALRDGLARRTDEVAREVVLLEGQLIALRALQDDQKHGDQ